MIFQFCKFKILTIPTRNKSLFFFLLNLLALRIIISANHAKLCNDMGLYHIKEDIDMEI